MKVCFLYIGTGDYIKFWSGFYESVMKFMYSPENAIFIVFTDSEDFKNKYISSSSVRVVMTKSEVWPFPTLHRFNYFMNAKLDSVDADVFVFCNANLRFVSNFSMCELLAGKSYFATRHPGYDNVSKIKFPLETRSESLAFVNRDLCSEYVCGGFYGGLKLPFLKAIRALDRSVSFDFSNNIIARWHDESHWNAYFNKFRHEFNLLDSDFCRPSDHQLVSNARAIILDKSKVIGVRNKGYLYTVKFYIFKFLKLFRRYL